MAILILNNNFYYNNLASNFNKIYAFNSENKSVPRAPTLPIPNKKLNDLHLQSTSIMRPIILSSERIPIPESFISNGYIKLEKNKYNNAKQCKLSLNNEEISLTNIETPPPPPLIVLPNIPIINNNKKNNKIKQQRYSYSFDPFLKFFNEEKSSNKQNRISAPIEQSCLENTLLNLPPLPPLPTPSNNTLKNKFLFENETKLTESKLMLNDSLKKQEKKNSSIPILLNKKIFVSRTPSPTVETGTQTNGGVVSALKFSFWYKQTQKNINKKLIEQNFNHKIGLFILF